MRSAETVLGLFMNAARLCGKKGHWRAGYSEMAYVRFGEGRTEKCQLMATR